MALPRDAGPVVIVFVGKPATAVPGNIEFFVQLITGMRPSGRRGMTKPAVAPPAF